MTQIARNLTDPNDGFLRGKRYLILDRDTKYSDAFRSVLVREGIQVVRLFNADSASAECSATTIGPQPDECRFFFWTIRGKQDYCLHSTQSLFILVIAQ